MRVYSEVSWPSVASWRVSVDIWLALTCFPSQPSCEFIVFRHLKNVQISFYSPTMRSFFSPTANDNKLPNSFSRSSRHQQMPPFLSLIRTLGQTHRPGFGFGVLKTPIGVLCRLLSLWFVVFQVKPTKILFFLNIKVRISQFSRHCCRIRDGGQADGQALWLTSWWPLSSSNDTHRMELSTSSRQTPFPFDLAPKERKKGFLKGMKGENKRQGTSRWIEGKVKRRNETRCVD